MGRLKVYNQLTAQWEYVAEGGGIETSDTVLITRTINGKALSSNIVLNPDDLDDATTAHKFASAAQIANIHAPHSDDQDLSDYVETTDTRLSDDRDPTVHGSDKHAVAYLDSTDIITYIGSVQPTVTQPSLWIETNATTGDVESMWLVDVGDNV